MDQDKLSNLYRRPPIDDTYQVSVYLAKRFQRRRFFRNQPIRNKNCLWWPCLLTDRDEMSNLYRGHAIDASNVNLCIAVVIYIINRGEFFRRKFPKCDHRFGNTFIFCTDISYIYVKNLNT